MLVFVKMCNCCYSIIFYYDIIKPNITFLCYTLNFFSLTNYILILATFQKLLDFYTCFFYTYLLYLFYNTNINAISINWNF